MRGPQHPSASPPSHDAGRIRLPRVRTGCLSCKAAHVKCDEAKPACHRCHRAARPCAYPAPPGHKKKAHDVSSARALLAARKPLRHLLPAFGSKAASLVPAAAVALLNRPIQFSDLDDPNAAIYFDRFKAQAARYRSATNESDDFWFRTLLRETAHDKGILAAVLSLGALAQAFGNAAEHVSLFSLNCAILPDSQQTSYRDAVKYYSLSISRLRQRLENPELLHEEPSPKDTAPAKQYTSRSVLISSILYSAFELMHGNSYTADCIVAKSMSILRTMILHGKQLTLPALADLTLQDKAEAPRQDVPYIQISRSCDDEGIEEAEWLLVRRAVLGALYAPMRPLSRDVICRLPGLNFLAGSSPPPINASPMTFWKLYFRWVPLAALWYVRAGSVRLPVPGERLSGAHEQEHAIKQAGLLEEEPWASLLREREALSEQVIAWETAVHAKLTTTLTTEESSILLQILPNCKNLRYQFLTLFDSIMNPEKRAEMRTLACEIIDIGEKVFEALPGITEGRDEMRESLSAVGVLMSQNCRESSNVRRRALKLCKRLIDSQSRWDAKGLVMGISKLMELEEEGRDFEEDMIPVHAQWDWTNATWNDAYTELDVLYTSRALTTAEEDVDKFVEDGVPLKRRMTLKPGDYGY
ncbi:uncharacterized protein B0I36DRAFT_354031 [Microdochium trichocladiopsis]|uniref:Zn(2)-C6 fungal-type domain-containing protein n=1 Tax=Microdochium trichocladiopsis TaxID=1682393 RepID=A0A9P8XWS2_9PEZI|nr:uncharacterized protein B0I36DRAFT_354031 [Microdochium trichocladiopsis]KAH7021367.1 hypothetical protein B0I36DRAFT_354031 [Microdochium trichocladiopsis]